jgi:sugar lactone lactonase YvrE
LTTCSVRRALLVPCVAVLSSCVFSANPEKRNGALAELAPVYSSSVVEVVAELPAPPGNLAVGPDGSVYFSWHPEASPKEHLAVLLPDGSWEPFPSPEWQYEREDEPYFVAPLGLRVDSAGLLWVLDHGDYGGDDPFLAAFDLKTRELVHHYVFESDVANWGSMLNDLAVDAERGFIYIADPSPFDFDPALVVYDIKARRAWRVLEDHDSVEAEDMHTVARGIFIKAYGLPLQLAVDSISLSADGDSLFYGPLSGGTLYRVPTATLRDPPEEPGDRVHAFGSKPITDGIVTDSRGNTYLTAVEHDAIAVLDSAGSLSLLVQNAELLCWPDGLALSPDERWLYVTCSQLHTVIGQDLDDLPKHAPYRILRIPLSAR